MSEFFMKKVWIVGTLTDDPQFAEGVMVQTDELFAQRAVAHGRCRYATDAEIEAHLNPPTPEPAPQPEPEQVQESEPETPVEAEGEPEPGPDDEPVVEDVSVEDEPLEDEPAEGEPEQGD